MNKYIYRTLSLSYTKIDKIISRDFSINLKRYNKFYKDVENNYAFDLMTRNGYVIKNNAHVFNTSLPNSDIAKTIQRNWFKETPSNLFKMFEDVCLYCSTNNFCISNSIFDNFIDNLTDSVQFFSDKEIQSMFYLLKSLPVTYSPKTRNFIELWAALDDACLARRTEWSFDEQLNMISLMHMVCLVRVTEFPFKCILRMANKAKQLTPSQLVQVLFYIGVMRKPPKDMHNLEVQLESNFTKFNIDDLAIMSMGFFKSQTPIRNIKLLTEICNKVIENSDTIKEISLTSLLKNIRYSVRVYENDCIYKLLDNLQHQIHRLSVMCCVHIALLGTVTLKLHENCLNEIAKRVVNNFQNARIKDLERLALVFGIFNFIPSTKEPFFELLLKELKNPDRNVEIMTYGRPFASCVAYLSLLGIHSTELIDKILDENFLNQAYGKEAIYSYGREILALHNTAAIYFKDININSLSNKTVTILAKKYTDYIPNVNYCKQYNASERMMIDVMTTLKKSRGDDCVIGDHILTQHQRGDIILCNDPRGTPVAITTIQKSFKFGPIIWPPDNNNKWIVLILVGKNAIIYNSNKPSGPFISKMRDLKQIGYHPALVVWNIWMTLRTHEERSQYLEDLIQQATKP